jgi:hypothetical protein
MCVNVEFFAQIFGDIKNNFYFCSVQLVILIYIYHFPRRESICEDRVPFFLSPSTKLGTGDGSGNGYV